MNLKGLSYKELLDLQLAITNEFFERFFKEPEGHADELVAIKDLEMQAGSLRTVFEQSGKVPIGEPE